MEDNIFTAKTVDEAIETGLSTLGITLGEAEIEVLEEGKKKLFGSVKAKVRITRAVTDGQRAKEFIQKLFGILHINAETELNEEGDDIRIDIKAAHSSKIIGKRGDVLDAIQCMAGAVANIGREDYKKVVVDCENYREQREATLRDLAEKLAHKAVEKGRKMCLEPMNPYERRIIHSALADNPDVKTASEGKEPVRYIVVIPYNAKPNDRGLKYGEKKPFRGGYGDKKFNRDRGDRPFDKSGEKRFSGDRRGGRRDDRRGDRPNRGGRSGAPRAKKEIYFGTYLGNSGAAGTDPSDGKKDGE